MKNLRHIALIGAICGDIIGSKYEFHPTKSPDFPLLPPGSTFTDDTVMTCAVADLLIKGGDLTKTLQAWGQRHGDIGYGPSFIKWLWADNPKPYNSYGNGAAMRASAVGWYARTLDQCLELAHQTAIVSHNHPDFMNNFNNLNWMSVYGHYIRKEDCLASRLQEIVQISLDGTTVRSWKNNAEICKANPEYKHTSISKCI